MALDTVGYAFESGYTKMDKSRWCDSTRLEFPKHLNKQVQTGTASFNSEFLSLFFLTISEESPITKQDFHDFNDEYKKVLDKYAIKNPTSLYTEYLSSQKNKEKLLMILAVGIGYYAGANTIDNLTFFHWTNLLFTDITTDNSQYYLALNLAFTVFRLCSTGYFGYASLAELQTNGILHGNMEEVLTMFMDRHPDPEFLINREDIWFEKLTYHEKLLCGIMYVLLRIDSAYPRDILKSLPRDQVLDVFTLDGMKEADSGFLFGCLCTISEHKHPLVPKPLRESVQYLNIVNSSLLYM